jgi:hypothetical protein
MAFDTSLMLRNGSVGDMTATETGSWTYIGNQVTPMEVQVVIPKVASNTNVTIVVDGANSSAGSGYVAGVGAVHSGATSGSPGAISASGEYFGSVHTPKPYLRYRATVAGSGSAAADFGAVDIGIVPAGRYAHY